MIIDIVVWTVLIVQIIVVARGHYRIMGTNKMLPKNVLYFNVGCGIVICALTAIGYIFGI